ncbi:transposase [Paenibacillus hemerocallicola]|nr:transposase [Paenibacillus hemerocallicola]
MGQKAYSVRVALGGLIIKERLCLSDRETTLQIMENPYLQFFLGFPGYLDQEPFHHSLLTHFRARLGADILAEINDWIATESLASKPKEKDDKNDDDNDPDNGQLALEVGRRSQFRSRRNARPNRCVGRASNRIEDEN